MPEPLILILAAAMGGILGALFFGGLWWTTLRGLASPLPGAWFMGSLLLRTVVTLGGFALVSRGHWDRMLACLFGFFLARLVVLRLTRPLSVHSLETPLASLPKEAGHAP